MDVDSGTSEIQDSEHESGQPFMWKVTEGVLYAEMSADAVVRPPLLSEWESDRVREFRSPERRRQWLSARALAKALVRERLALPGIIEIRESRTGEPLVFRNGLPMTDVWLSIAVRHGRIAAVVARRPVALEIRRVEATDERTASRFLRRNELKSLRSVFRELPLIWSVGSGVKEAALRALRIPEQDSPGLRGVALHPDFSVSVGGTRLSTLALRVQDGVVVSIVGQRTPGDQGVTRIVTDAPSLERPRARSKSAFDRSLARARRLIEARARWQTPGWQT